MQIIYCFSTIWWTKIVCNQTKMCYNNVQCIYDLDLHALGSSAIRSRLLLSCLAHLQRLPPSVKREMKGRCLCE